MVMKIRLYLITIGLITVIACRSTPTNSGNKDTTVCAISGLVLEGPISPLQRPNEPNEAPLTGAEIAFELNSGMHVVGAVRSDSNGRFYAKLPVAGTWTLTPQPLPNMNPSGYPRPGAPSTITVTAGEIANDTLHYDT